MPLGLSCIIASIGRVSLVDETEVCCCLGRVSKRAKKSSKATHVVKSARHSTSKILQEEPSHVGVIDILSALINSRHRSRRHRRRSRGFRERRRAGDTSQSRGTTAQAAYRSILDLSRTSDALVDQRLEQFALHVTSGSRHTDIDTTFSGIACIDTIANSVAGDVDRPQVAARVVNSTLDNKSGAAFGDENVVVGFRAGRVGGCRLCR